MNEWTEEIERLRSFFNSVRHELPDPPIDMKRGEQIVDVKKFIRTNLRTVEAQNGNMTYYPYLQQLQELEQKIK